MSDTTFVDGVTPVPASWLNDVNDFVYTNGTTKTTLFGTNVYYLGILDDGSDQSTAIQAAIDSLSASGGGTLFFPRKTTGVYGLGSTGITLRNRVTLEGEGAPYIGTSSTSNTTPVTFQCSGASAVRFGDGSTFGTQGGVLRNLGIFGNGTGTNGVVFYGTSGSAATGNLIENCHISNFTGNGIEVTQYSFVNTVKDSSVSKCGIGVYLKQEANDWTLDNVKNTANTVNFTIGSGSGTSQSGIRLLNVKSENAVNEGIIIQNPTRSIDLIGIYSEANGKEGIKSTSTTATISILGGECHINNALYSNISLNAGTIFHIEGVAFSGSSKYDIDLNSVGNYYGRIGPCRHGATNASGRFGYSTVGSDTLVEITDTYTPEHYQIYGTSKSYGILNAASSGATGSRPTLNTRNRGSLYFDTTLNANGKPIFWTGTIWVDATGASV